MKTSYLGMVSLLFATMLTVSFVSCGDDDENGIDDSQIVDNTSHTSNENSVERLINSTVYPMVSYLNYSYQVEITSTLSETLPGKDIRYGIECGYGGYDWEKYATKSIGNSYSCVSSIFLDTEDDFAVEALYWSSFVDLLEKQESRGLRDDEQQLYNEIVKTLRKSESNAKSQYQGRVFVKVDGKKYYIKNF